MKIVLQLLLISAANLALVSQVYPEEAKRSENYQLTPGDIIAVKVFREPDLDSQHRVSKDGTIDFPLIHTVHIAGKTTSEAQELIASLLDKDYLVNPQVTVDIVTYAKQRFTVLGQVSAAGSFAIPDEESVNLVQAIAAAGGFTRLADLGHVILTRQDGQQFTVDCRPGSKAPQSIHVRANDTITVKERLF